MGRGWHDGGLKAKAAKMSHGKIEWSKSNPFSWSCCQHMSKHVSDCQTICQQMSTLLSNVSPSGNSPGRPDSADTVWPFLIFLPSVWCEGSEAIYVCFLCFIYIYINIRYFKLRIATVVCFPCCFPCLKWHSAGLRAEWAKRQVLIPRCGSR